MHRGAAAVFDLFASLGRQGGGGGSHAARARGTIRRRGIGKAKRKVHLSRRYDAPLSAPRSEQAKPLPPSSPPVEELIRLGGESCRSRKSGPFLPGRKKKCRRRDPAVPPSRTGSTAPDSHGHMVGQRQVSLSWAVQATGGRRPCELAGIHLSLARQVGDQVGAAFQLGV